MTPPSLEKHLAIKPVGDVLTVEFLDRELRGDLENNEIRDELIRRIDSGGVRKMVLNMKNVQYMASASLGLLIRLHSGLEKIGGQLRLCGVDNRMVAEVFRISKFDQILHIDDDEATSLLNLASA